MDIRLINNFPLSIKEQIKQQIISMIEEHRLNYGDLLLSAKELGVYLNVNRNTVAAAYKELASAGYVTVIKGSGTYISKRPVPSEADHLKRIFEQAYARAREKGFTPDQITDTFISGLLSRAAAPPEPARIILIDCNYEILDTLELRLKSRVAVECHHTLIQDIQALPDKFLKRADTADLILCGMNHLEELSEAVPELSCRTIGFMIRTDFVIMNQIAQLPPGTRVGYCCISQKSSEAFFSSAVFPSGTRLIRCHAGIDDIDLIQEMTRTCDILFATHYVYGRLAEMVSDPEKIIRVDLEIDPQNLDFIVRTIQKEG